MSDNDYKTSADLAYDIICKNILEGKLDPGQKLNRREMAKLTGVNVEVKKV